MEGVRLGRGWRGAPGLLRSRQTVALFGLVLIERGERHPAKLRQRLLKNLSKIEHPPTKAARL
jgi:hypothetical protein